jgi:hypothetical protein
MSSATWLVAVAVKHSTRGTLNSSTKRAILRYSGRKEAPHCMDKTQTRFDEQRRSLLRASVTYLRDTVGFIDCEEVDTAYEGRVRARSVNNASKLTLLDS